MKQTANVTGEWKGHFLELKPADKIKGSSFARKTTNNYVPLYSIQEQSSLMQTPRKVGVS
jgi:hypothetical protein